MIDQLKTLGDRVLQRSVENERSFVDDPKRARYLMWRDGVLAVIAFAALIVNAMTSDGGNAIASVIVGAFVGLSLMIGIRRASTYRSGWLAGRSLMVSTLDESMRRGMSPAEWLERELDRDLLVMGLEPRHRREDDPSRDDTSEAD